MSAPLAPLANLKLTDGCEVLGGDAGEGLEVVAGRDEEGVVLREPQLRQPTVHHLLPADS